MSTPLRRTALQHHERRKVPRVVWPPSTSPTGRPGGRGDWNGGQRRPVLSSVIWQRPSPGRNSFSNGAVLAAQMGRNAMLSCAAARAFVSSLLDRRTAESSDGVTPLSHDVEGDFRHWGLEHSVSLSFVVNHALY